MPSVSIYGGLASPPTRNVLITAKAIGLDINLKFISLATGEHLGETFKKLNPAKVVPLLEDDGFYLMESRAIMTYLMNKYANGDKYYPKDLHQRAKVESMLHFDNGTFYAAIARYYFPVCFYGKTSLDTGSEANLKDKMSILDDILSRNPYAAGDQLTIADFSIFTSLTVAEAGYFSFDPYKNIKKYYEKVRNDIPSYDKSAKDGETEMRDVWMRPKLKSYFEK